MMQLDESADLVIVSRGDIPGGLSLNYYAQQPINILDCRTCILDHSGIDGRTEGYVCRGRVVSDVALGERE